MTQGLHVEVGEWTYGVDFSVDSQRVILVRAGGLQNDVKYGFDWIGPLDMSASTIADKAAVWCKTQLSLFGGYIHMLPADGDAHAALNEWIAYQDEEEE